MAGLRECHVHRFLRGLWVQFGQFDQYALPLHSKMYGSQPQMTLNHPKSMNGFMMFFFFFF